MCATWPYKTDGAYLDIVDAYEWSDGENGRPFTDTSFSGQRNYLTATRRRPMIDFLTAIRKEAVSTDFRYFRRTPNSWFIQLRMPSTASAAEHVVHRV